MAISACDIEVRADGNDLNGGGFKIGGSGTDYALANTPLIRTDLACASNTTLTSAMGGFTEQHVGNLLQLASGTNALAGWYEITAYTDTNTVTIDRTCATGGNMTAGAGRIGGALATPGQAANLMNSADTAVAGHRVHQKEGTYNNTETTVNVPGGPLDFANGVHNMYNKVLYWEGYKTIRGDMDGTITIDANGNAPASGYMWRMGGNSSGSHQVVNINLDADSQTSIDGFYASSALYNVVTQCYSTAADFGFYYVTALRCLAASCATGFQYSSCDLSVASSCTYGFGSTDTRDCIAYGCGRGWYAQPISATRCLAYNCTTAGFESNIPVRTSRLVDCIAYSCGYSFLGMEYSMLINCASGNPTSGRYDAGGDPIGDINPITLSNTVGDVFVNAAAGDFRLVNTEGGGALLWAKGLGVIGQTDANRDIGAVQHADPRASDYGLTAEILKDGETVDDVVGTYEGAGGGGGGPLIGASALISG